MKNSVGLQVKKWFVFRWVVMLLGVCCVSLLTGCNLDPVDDTTYTLSGTISGDVAGDVTVTLSGTSSASTTTDSSGDYSFTVTAGTYTVTPTLTGYSFSPTSTSVTISDEDVSDVDFTSATSTIGDRTDYTSVTLTSGGTYASDTSGVENEYYSYTSTESDTPAIKVASGGSLTLTYSYITKTGDTSSTENSGFYGFNSGVLASSSSSSSSYSGTDETTTLTMTDCTIETDASGANGAFAFGEDATVTLDHVTIVTTGDSNSRGVDATYGGTVVITDSTISTQGGSCAALATDRYDNANAPTIIATNVEGTTAGSGSPGIYCTGTFTVTDSILTATGSEAAVIEGLNSITLNNTDISGSEKWGVMIYQSMSGDSSIGTGTFEMTDGTLTNNYSEGPLFFICNTDAVIDLAGATLVNTSDMLLVAGKASTASNYIDNVNSSWGTSGGIVTFTAEDEELIGDIILCDSSSSIDLTLTNSSLSGAVNAENNGTADLTIDADSTWEVTGTSYLNSLTNYGTITGTGTLYVDGSEYSY